MVYETLYGLMDQASSYDGLDEERLTVGMYLLAGFRVIVPYTSTVLSDTVMIQPSVVDDISGSANVRWGAKRTGAEFPLEADLDTPCQHMGMLHARHAARVAEMLRMKKRHPSRIWYRPRQIYGPEKYSYCGKQKRPNRA